MVNRAQRRFAADTESQPGGMGPTDPSRRLHLIATAGAAFISISLWPTDTKTEPSSVHSGYISTRPVPNMGSTINSLADAQLISKGTPSQGLVVLVEGPGDYGTLDMAGVLVIENLRQRCAIIRVKCQEVPSGYSAAFVDGVRVQGLDSSPEGLFSVRDAAQVRGGLRDRIMRYVAEAEARGTNMSPPADRTAMLFYNAPL